MSPPAQATPSLLLSPPWARLPLMVLLLIVALPASDINAAAEAASPNADAPAPPSAWLPVIWQSVMVRMPPRLWRPPPLAPLRSSVPSRPRSG